MYVCIYIYIYMEKCTDMNRYKIFREFFGTNVKRFSFYTFRKVSIYIYIYIYIYISSWISLILSDHLSLLSIASYSSSRLHPVSVQSFCR